MKKLKTVNSKQLAVSSKNIRIYLCLPFALLKLSLCIVSVFVCVIALSGCATEYYPPRDSEKQGAIKRKGFVSWSNGIGKNLPLANPSFSVVGK